MDDGWKSIADRKLRRKAYGHAWYMAHREQVIAQSKAYTKAHPEKSRRAYKRRYYRKHAEERSIEHRLKTYGLSDRAYRALWESQGGACWLCRRVRKLGIDHEKRRLASVTRLIKANT